MQKELDLTTAKMANDKYDIEKLKRKSIQDSHNSKRQRIHGETYPSKKITKKQILTVCGIVAAAVAATAILNHVKVDKRIDASEEYQAILQNVAEDELSISESIDFLDNFDNPKEHYERYIEALESLDDTEYDFFGNRKDGTHNDLVNEADPNTSHPVDKKLDAMQKASEQQVQEYREYKGAK